jgi:UDP-N-acetylglucosamine acyltransferase
MIKIDPTARVEDGAIIGEGVSIGAYCVIGADVRIGPECRLLSHVHIMGQTSIGAECTIYPFASLGGPPHDLSHRGEPTRLEIGDGCIIREGVTMNTGTAKGGGLTRVGDRGYFMSNSHIGHDCVVGNDVIFASSATLGGHCIVGDLVYFGGMSAAHQFVRIGPQSMIAGCSGLRGDVIPYGRVNGQYAYLEGLNVVGMRRRKFSRARLQLVRSFYRSLFRAPGIFADRLASARDRAKEDPAIADILNFIDEGKKRPLCMPLEIHGTSDSHARTGW